MDPVPASTGCVESAVPTVIGFVWTTLNISLHLQKSERVEQQTLNDNYIIIAVIDLYLGHVVDNITSKTVCSVYIRPENVR